MALDCGNPADIAGVACPGDEAMWHRALADMFPRGFAWDAIEDDTSTMYLRLQVAAMFLADFHAKACELVSEFNCDTASTTLDSWDADFGLPDPCGIAELCPKVTTIGDGTCQSLQDIASSIGKVRIMNDPTLDAILPTLTPGTVPYETQLATHAPYYGIELCCNDVAPEVQVGCWNMGCDQMPPPVEWLGGGCDLGFLSMGFCPPDLGGSPLGQEIINSPGGDCYVSGYRYLSSTTTVIPPCDVPACKEWTPPSSGEFITGCPSPWHHDYVGTAYHVQVGIKGTSYILQDPTYSQMGCMNMGCSELCVPPVAELLCFIGKHAHAHLKLLPIYC